LKITPSDDQKVLNFFKKENPIFDIQSTQLLIVAEYPNQNNNIWKSKTCLLNF
jgi:hypothetical protein